MHQLGKTRIGSSAYLIFKWQSWRDAVAVVFLRVIFLEILFSCHQYCTCRWWRPRMYLYVTMCSQIDLSFRQLGFVCTIYFDSGIRNDSPWCLRSIRLIMHTYVLHLLEFFCPNIESIKYNKPAGVLSSILVMLFLFYN